MSELDDFRTETLARQAEVVEALLLGNSVPWLAMWSTRYPVTLLGAWGPCKTGWDELSKIFRWVASRFSDVGDFSFDVEVAELSGDLAYTVGYERFTGSVDGGPVAAITLRVTHVYHRENDEWKVIHRHADFAPADESLPG
ncbi:MAG: YybH family protein, partial [Pseudonocardiaceae bacterium]